MADTSIIFSVIEIPASSYSSSSTQSFDPHHHHILSPMDFFNPPSPSPKSFNVSPSTRAMDFPIYEMVTTFVSDHWCQLLTCSSLALSPLVLYLLYCLIHERMESIEVRNMLIEIQHHINTWPQILVALQKSCRGLKKENKRLRRKIREMEAWVSEEDVAVDG